jgi:PAS domain S-box-containing protein
LGYKNRKSIVTPLRRRGKIIGVLVMSAPDLAERFAPSVESFARHVSTALQLADEESRRELAKKALAEGEERFRDLYENAPNAYLSVGVDGRIHTCNRRAGELLAIGVEELVGRPVLELYADTPQGKEKAEGVLERLRAGETVRNEELQMQKADGTPIWINLTLNSIQDAQGRVVESRSVVVDITDRKKVEEDLRRSEETYKELVELAPDGIVAIDTKGVITSVNAAFLEWTGYAREDFIGKSVLKVATLRARDVPGYLRPMASLLKGEIPPPTEFAYKTRDGRERLAEAHVGQLKEKAKRVGYQFILRDITDRKKAEDERSKLSKFPDENPNPVLRISRDGSVLYSNKPSKPLLELWGYQEDESLPGEWLRYATDALREDSPQQANAICGDRVYSLTFAPIKDFGYVNVYGLDITDLRRGEEAMHRLYGAVQASTDSIVITDLEGRIVDLNHATLDMFGSSSRSDLLGRNTFDMVDPEDRERTLAGMEEIMKTGYRQSEYRVVTRDGRRVPVESRVSLLKSEGRPSGFVGISRDITERRKAEAELRRYSERLEELVEERTNQLQDSHRMATIGETTTMVGHDLRNPLQAIVNNLYLAKKRLDRSKFEGKDDLTEKLETIQEQIGYMNKIVSDLQDFARPVVPKLYKTDMEALARGVLSSKVNTPSIPVSVDVVASEDLPKLVVDASLMKRVLTNLVTNAVQAMPDGGELTVDLRTQGRDAVISVKDTGVGIPEENMGKLFDPLFTTKSMGQGFGLPVCKRLIEAHAGTITPESTTGEGSVFTIRLPLDAE